MMPVALGTSKHDGRMTFVASLRCNGQWRSDPSQSKSRQRELPRSSKKRRSIRESRCERCPWLMRWR